MEEISFLAYIDPSLTALKISGDDRGGKLTLEFDDTQLPEAIKAVVMRKKLLKVTIRVEKNGKGKEFIG
jgi:hypothetical protein